MDVREIDHVTWVTLAAEELEDGLQVQQTREQLYHLIYAGRRHLIVDLRHVEYLGSSAALSLFIMVQKKLLTGGGVLGLRNLNRAVRQLFELTRLTDLFDIRSDPDFPS